MSLKGLLSSRSGGAARNALSAAASRFWVREISPMLMLSSGIALVGSTSGLLISYHADLPTGPTIVLCLGVLYLLSLVFGRQGLLQPRSPQHLKA